LARAGPYGGRSTCQLCANNNERRQHTIQVRNQAEFVAFVLQHTKPYPSQVYVIRPEPVAPAQLQPVQKVRELSGTQKQEMAL